VELILLYTSVTEMPSWRSNGKMYVEGIGRENVDCVQTYSSKKGPVELSFVHAFGFHKMQEI
jgi:hypothetical protein